MQNEFLPMTREEMDARGWDAPDFVFISGDAYVDHPSFGCAVLTRVLAADGFRVAVLAQPAWRDVSDFKRFGRPRYGFLISAGVIDSMVNHYTVAKKRRGEDVYSPGGQKGHRPDRATIVYANRARQAYGDVPIVIGGIEASLRRFSHYDYWDDRVRHSILIDAGADLLLFGMGEETIVRAARAMRDGHLQDAAPQIPGACWTSQTLPEGYFKMPSHEEVAGDTRAYAGAFLLQHRAQDPVRGQPLAQCDGGRWVLQNRPQMPLTRAALDRVYALPFTRRWHPAYDEMGGVPALEEVKFSIAATRGCFGACNFCALTFHQGRIVASRSPESILKEAKAITALPDFKGYIHDVGGPTANFRRPACDKQMSHGTCETRQCLYPHPCKRLRVDHAEFLKILRRVRELPGVKKVFVRSGLRYDYILADKESPFLRELCQHHVSGRLKVAPEHVSAGVLDLMGKPRPELYDRFVQKFDAINRAAGLKQYVQPYLMSSHPGSDMLAAVQLAEYLRDSGQHPEQVQDFYPTPGTLSTCMFYTGLDPRTMQPVYVPRSPHEKAMQRALMQYRLPKNRRLVREALTLAGRDDLIGYGKQCLIPPVGEGSGHRSGSPTSPSASRGGGAATRGKDGPKGSTAKGGKQRKAAPKRSAAAKGRTPAQRSPAPQTPAGKNRLGRQSPRALARRP